jgi:hypothetical protein
MPLGRRAMKMARLSISAGMSRRLYLPQDVANIGLRKSAPILFAGVQSRQDKFIHASNSSYQKLSTRGQWLASGVRRVHVNQHDGYQAGGVFSRNQDGDSVLRMCSVW